MIQGSREGLLTPAEVAALFGVSVTTIRTWAGEGRLTPVFTLGGRRRYWRRETTGLLAEKEPKPPQPSQPVCSVCHHPQCLGTCHNCPYCSQ